MTFRGFEAATHGLTRVVGREGELEQLRQALGRTAGSRGQVVALVGKPGVGKSRLVWEITHSHRVDGWLVLQAASVSYGKATSYPPVVDLLKRYFAIEDPDTASRGVSTAWALRRNRLDGVARAHDRVIDDAAQIAGGETERHEH